MVVGGLAAPVRGVGVVGRCGGAVFGLWAGLVAVVDSGLLVYIGHLLHQFGNDSNGNPTTGPFAAPRRVHSF